MHIFWRVSLRNGNPAIKIRIAQNELFVERFVEPDIDATAAKANFVRDPLIGPARSERTV